MNSQFPFDAAVADYITRLDKGRREILRTTILNPQAEQDWHWFAEVIDRYHLRDKFSSVSRDINERVEPDPFGINSLWAGIGNSEPIFEAFTFINAARKILEAAPINNLRGNNKTQY